MAQAKRDDNRIPTLIAVSDADSTTPIVIEGDATSAGLNVNIVSDDVGVGGGTQVTFGTTTYTEASSIGTAAAAVRNDTLASLVDTDNEFAPLQVNASGALYIQEGAAMDVSAATVTVDGSGVTQPISAASLPLPSGAATAANQLADGHNVTVDNAAGASAVNIQDGGNTITVDNGGTFVVQEDGAALTSLQLIDDIVSTDDTTTHSTGTTKGANIMAAATPTDGSVAANDIGMLAMSTDRRLHTDTQIVGQDADITIADGGNSITVDNSVLSVVGGGTEATAQRVTIANDSTGVLSVDDNGSSLSVDYGGTAPTVLNAGLQVTGDEAHDGVDAGNPIKIGGRAQDIIGAEPEEVADNDRVDALFDQNGRLGVTAGSDYKYADINDSTSGDNSIVAAQAAGKRIAVWAILIVSDGTTDCRWEDGAGGTAFTGQVPLQAREGYSISSGGLVPLFVGSAATALNLELTAAVNVHGFVSYTVLED